MLQITKTFLVCAGKGCINVLGCFEKEGQHRFCETTKPGDTQRTFGCNKETFFQCSLEKDMLESGEATGGAIMVLSGSICRHCPADDKTFQLTEDEMGPVAILSSSEICGESLDDLISEIEKEHA